MVGLPVGGEIGVDLSATKFRSVPGRVRALPTNSRGMRR